MTATEESKEALKTQDLATGRVASLRSEALPTSEPNPLATESVSLVLAETPIQSAFPRSYLGCAEPVETAVSPSPSLTPAQAAQQRQWQQREAAKEAQQRLWLSSGDPILVKEAEAWFAGRAQRLQAQVTVEQIDPGG